MSELKTLPGQRVVCLGKTVPLFTQEYEWVPAICQGSLMKCKGGGGATLQWTCISSREGVMILLVTSYSGNWDKLLLEYRLYLNHEINDADWQTSYLQSKWTRCNFWWFVLSGTNIAEQLDAASIVPMASPPPPAVPTPQSPVNPLPPNRPDLFSPGLVNVPGPSVAGPMQSVPMVQDRKYVPGPSTALPGGVVPKTERFDTWQLRWSGVVSGGLSHTHQT